MLREIELNDWGSVICRYDDETGEIESIESWKGGDLSGTKWERIAKERVYELTGIDAYAFEKRSS